MTEETKTQPGPGASVACEEWSFPTDFVVLLRQRVNHRAARRTHCLSASLLAVTSGVAPSGSVLEELVAEFSFILDGLKHRSPQSVRPTGETSESPSSGTKYGPSSISCIWLPWSPSSG